MKKNKKEGVAKVGNDKTYYGIWFIVFFDTINFYLFRSIFIYIILCVN